MRLRNHNARLSALHHPPGLQTLDQTAAARPLRRHTGEEEGSSDAAQTLGSMGADPADKAYEAFVTSERPQVGARLSSLPACLPPLPS